MQKGLRGMNSPIQVGPKAKCDIYRNKAPTPEPSTQATVTPANRTACFAQTELLSLALFPRQWCWKMLSSALLSSLPHGHLEHLQLLHSFGPPQGSIPSLLTEQEWQIVGRLGTCRRAGSCLHHLLT